MDSERKFTEPGKEHIRTNAAVGFYDKLKSKQTRQM